MSLPNFIQQHCQTISRNVQTLMAILEVLSGGQKSYLGPRMSICLVVEIFPKVAECLTDQ